MAWKCVRKLIAECITDYGMKMIFPNNAIVVYYREYILSFSAQKE